MHKRGIEYIVGLPHPSAKVDLRAASYATGANAHESEAIRYPCVPWGLSVAAHTRYPAALNVPPQMLRTSAGLFILSHTQLVPTASPMVTRLLFVSSALCFSKASRAFFVASFCRNFRGSFKAS